MAEGIVYKACIDSNLPNYKQKEYKGICATTFKVRFGNYKNEFKDVKYRNRTELTKEVWAIKDRKGVPKVSWSIFGKFPPYNPISKKCNLCLNEKLEIATYNGDNLLNKRSEVVSKCRHINKYKLDCITSRTRNDNIT